MPEIRKFTGIVAGVVTLTITGACTGAIVVEKLTPEGALGPDEGVVLTIVDTAYPASFRLTRVDRGSPGVVVTPFLISDEGIQFLRIPAGSYRITAVQLDEVVYPLEAWRHGILHVDVKAGQLNYPGDFVVLAKPYAVDMSRSGPQRAGATRAFVALDVSMIFRNREHIARALLTIAAPELADRFEFVYTGDQPDED